VVVFNSSILLIKESLETDIAITTRDLTLLPLTLALAVTLSLIYLLLIHGTKTSFLKQLKRWNFC
jgi:hypothetical protein